MYKGLVQLAVYTHLLLVSTVVAGELVDPTTPLSMYTDVSSKVNKKLSSENDVLNLACIIVGPNSKIAIINGRRYRELDHLGGFVVSKISAKSVILNKGNEHLQLSILSAVSSSEKAVRSL